MKLARHIYNNTFIYNFHFTRMYIHYKTIFFKNYDQFHHDERDSSSSCTNIIILEVKSQNSCKELKPTMAVGFSLETSTSSI